MADTPTKSTEQLGVLCPIGAKDRLKELQASIRQAGRGLPSQGLIVAALIDHEGRRGAELDDELLVPYRKAHPDVDPAPE
jgi:hypothetical protein